MQRTPDGRFDHRPLDLDALREAAQTRAELRRAEHDAPAPAGDAAELISRIEGLLRWSAG